MCLFIFKSLYIFYILQRVQANGPGEENTVIKPRDTVMVNLCIYHYTSKVILTNASNGKMQKETHPDLEHEDCNEFSYQEPSSLANHVSDVQVMVTS